MKGYLAFTKKEFTEQLRTFKWLIVFSVFFIFGMMSPLFAKLMPEIFEGMKVQGMEFIIPEPTVMDAYGQFFKNISQMGIFVILLVFGGMISNELTKGTLINVLAKGLPRHTVILSKYTAAVTLWTAGYLLAAATTYGYSLYLFENVGVENLAFSLFCLWLFVCFILSLILLSSTIAAGNFGGLILSGTALVVMLMLNIFPKAEKFNPITLASKNMALLSGEQQVSDLMITVWVTCVLMIGCLIISIVLFNKKKL
jgi:ABC-2 type transport system permease protein